MLMTLQFSKLFLVAPQVTFPLLLMVYQQICKPTEYEAEKKCKEMVITFLKYQPSPVLPMFLNGAAIVRVSSFKLLGVTLSNDLSWNDHCDEMLEKACKRLYALRSLKAAGLNQKDLLLVYCSLVRSVVEYASPASAALPIYLQDMLEAVQKKALYIIFGKMEYKEAMETAGL